jgi:Ferritin-like domain
MTMTSNVRNQDQRAQPPESRTTLLGETPAGGGTLGRRSFLRRGVAAAGAASAAAALPGAQHNALAQLPSGSLFPGDAAILRFLAAAEIIESDLWQQYNELAGIQGDNVPGGSGNPAFTEAVAILDEDMAQYIHDNTEDEISHVSFINAYLMAHGAAPANLDAFRTLPSSKATGAQQIGRITNLTQLTVDTTWWSRYRNPDRNPDLDPSFRFEPVIPGLMNGKFKAIPTTDDDLMNNDHLTAIAFTAGFHFGTIEQGGSSLYPALAQRVTHPEVLRILLSIGPTETMHFQTWQDKAGNATPVTDPITGLTFPDLSGDSEVLQKNKIMPEPTPFLSRRFPRVSIIRPTETRGAATAALSGLVASGLFLGQSTAFFHTLGLLAKQADAARRGFGDD